MLMPPLYSPSGRRARIDTGSGPLPACSDEKSRNVTQIFDAYSSQSLQAADASSLLVARRKSEKRHLSRDLPRGITQGPEYSAAHALFTPPPLGPLYDIARQTQGELLTLLEQQAPPPEPARWQSFLIYPKTLSKPGGVM
jgi:hypothetical protein